MIKSICFLTTYRCDAKCDFCECGPQVRDRLELSEMKRIIDQGAEIGTVGQVVFSGGEPTLLGGDLFEIIEYAAGKGMLTRVVTNGGWGKKAADALVVVDRLIGAGLHEINISIDDLHQRWINIDYVKNSFLACYIRRFKCLIAHKQLISSKITKEYLEDKFEVKLINYCQGTKYTDEEQCRLFSTGSVIPVGRNEGRADPKELIAAKWWGNCSAILRDIVVGAKGNFLPCCGIIKKGIPDLTRENLKQVHLIEAIENANNDLLLNWLALEGPAAIMYAVSEWDSSVTFPEKFAGICHVCNEVLTRNEVRRVIAGHIDEVASCISLHRATFELARPDNELINMYVPTN